MCHRDDFFNRIFFFLFCFNRRKSDFEDYG